MAEHPIQNLMNVTMDKIRQMVDSNTIVGKPITTDDGTTILPVSPARPRKQLSARLLLTAAILLLIAGGFSPFSKDGSIPAFSGRVRLDA